MQRDDSHLFLLQSGAEAQNLGLNSLPHWGADTFLTEKVEHLLLPLNRKQNIRNATVCFLAGWVGEMEDHLDSALLKLQAEVECAYFSIRASLE